METANTYTQDMLVRICKRENNTKRTYLVMNPMQGKHIAVSPTNALELFKALENVVEEFYDDLTNTLFIGFAETATAIGAQVALSANAKYIQTTREIIPDVQYLFFSEEHSHATEQKLVKEDIDSVIKKIDRIIFVEDEVTTGNTILNIINVIRKTYPDTNVKFGVASILNGMTDEHLAKYSDEGIDLHFLVKTDHSKYSDIAAALTADGDYIVPSNTKADWNNIYEISGYMNSRRLVGADKYLDACNNLWNEFFEKHGENFGKNVLVVGTEEFMYPALFLGSKIEKCGSVVKCHSTTRSPIAVGKSSDYPVHTRYELKSMYDENRTIYLYDIGSYDEVFVITDSDNISPIGENSLYSALSQNNNNIVLIKWR